MAEVGAGTDRRDMKEFLRTGSPAAFERLAARYAAMVYGTCLRQVRRNADAEDAAQGVFLTLARKARSVNPERLGGWLHRTAIRSAMMANRAAAARARREEEAARMREATLESIDDAALDWDAVRPHLDSEVERLPAKLREAVVRHFFAGRSHAELAAELGVPRATAASRVQLGLKRLRAGLTRRGVTLGVAALGPALLASADVAAPASLLASLPQLASGTAAGASTSAQALAKGVLKMMFWAKVKQAAAVIVAVTTVGVGGGTLALNLSASEPQVGTTKPKEVDRKGPPVGKAGGDGRIRTFGGSPHDGDRSSSGGGAETTPKLPAFPGAEGCGAKSVGGRGGRIIKVTNLKSKGPGSLHAACAAKGPRIVVFDVSGVIKGDVAIKDSRITIAGQTAPGAGITIDGKMSSSDKKQHDVTVRFLRCRPTSYGVTGGGSGDCMQLTRINRLIIDHVSVSWGNDENMDLCVSSDITVQWCAIEESHLGYQKNSLHNFGMIMGYIDGQASLHHTLIAHHSNRAPLCYLTLDHRNNVLYNVSSAVMATYRLNLVGNYFKEGPGGAVGGRPWSPPARRARPAIVNGDRVEAYAKNNYFSWLDKYLDYGPNAQKMKKKKSEPWPFPKVTMQDPKESYKLVLAHAGCLPRDAVTKRTIREVRTGTGSWGRKIPPGGLMEGMTPGAAPKDSDNDGMPDAWEKAHKLNPEDPADAGKIVPAGASPGDRHKNYTYVEFYINELADRLIAEAKSEAAKTQSSKSTKKAK